MSSFYIFDNSYFIEAGSGVDEDDVVINLETDKVEVAIRAGHSGILEKIYKS